MLAQNRAAVDFRGAAAGDSASRAVARGDYVANAAGSVFGGDALQARMRAEKLLALRERHRMRFDDGDLFELRARRRDQIVRDRNDHLSENVERAIDEQVERAMDRAREAVLDRRENVIGRAVADRVERGFERGARDERNLLAEELHGGLFAEGAALALERHSRIFFNVHRSFP